MDYSKLYNTPIPDKLKDKYNEYLKGLDEHQRNTYDYDMQGAFLGNLKAGENKHFPDTYKKPNHPTFSNQSIYNGVNNNFGGVWTVINGQDVFIPSSTNYKHYPPELLQRYFDEVEWANLINDITE